MFYQISATQHIFYCNFSQIFWYLQAIKLFSFLRLHLNPIKIKKHLIVVYISLEE